MFQCIVQPRSEFGQRFQEMKGAFTGGFFITDRRQKYEENPTHDAVENSSYKD